MSPTAAARSYLERLQSRMDEARAQCEDLFEIVKPEALYDRPISERHRIIFYLGHLEAFDWNLLGGPLGLESFHPAFDKLFAFGIDPVDGGLPDDQPADWPALDEIKRYNVRLRETLDEGLRAVAAQDPNLTRFAGGHLLEVAIEHRLMHAETLCYMLHQLPLESKFTRPTLGAPASGGTLDTPNRNPSRDGYTWHAAHSKWAVWLG